MVTVCKSIRCQYPYMFRRGDFCICMCIYILPTSMMQSTNPSARAFKLSLTGLNLEFPFSPISRLTKVKDHSLPFRITGSGRLIRFIPFPRVLAWCEMQTVTSTIFELGSPCPFLTIVIITLKTVRMCVI